MADRVPARGNILGSLVPARYILAILGSIAMAIVYGLKVNLSVAMVAMLNHTAIKLSAGGVHNVSSSMTNLTTTVHGGDENCGSDAASEAAMEKVGPFNWSEPLQGTILSCYFWGYIVSQLPAARVAESFSAKYVMLFSVAINVVCTILTPLAAKFHYGAMIAMRIGEGIGGGVTFPAMHVMLATWAPPTERSTMSALVYAGTSLGTVMSMLLAGFLAGNYGWESVFYVMGLLSAIWILLWVWLIQDSPSKQPLISQEERNYINSSLGSGDKHGQEEAKSPVPWRRVFTSMPFLAILVAHTCSNWGWYTLLIETSFYFKQVLHFNIKENAVVSAIPFLTMWFFSMALSKGLDALRARGTVSTTFARKLSTLIASAIPMICLFALCYIGCRRGLAVLIMGIGITSIGGMFCGFLSNHIDIAPNYAGTLMAITNTFATLPGIIMPIFVGAVTHGNQTISAWRVIFYVTIVLYIIEMVMYTMFGSGEEQPWNKSQARELVSVGSVKPNGENMPLKGRDSRTVE
ncbi:sialin [Sitodiplosis mosellana]|uniref:sialin n=1 Tax=Sitodiplosis mosellana TaxID=263140 RepID=UPI0024445C7D|nr:sialin [Sitodiplosis mosellana]XP_055294875.1 sialin [Sitodiplosis mosellana]XP_055294876.1 sialin [Sitodiplosis mosellana]XP_055294877.1 sialin [Sitodiplosis mosellana]XP_055294878.1 sialin [Sitodiplosis mosellana]XP_055294879.1 sialin [Sitodiplosis mosellana]XP_055294880.1 sialin [Sitodiplosis mosellana]